jgi:hypothetical protein
VIPQDEAVAQVLASRTVSLDVAAAAIPMGRNKAHRHARLRGYLIPGVPVIRTGDWGYVVPTPALRRELQLEGPPLGATTRLAQGGTTEEAPRLGASSVTAQMSDRLKEGAPVAQRTRSPQG